MIDHKGPRGLYDNWFWSTRLHSWGVVNILCGQCVEVGSQSSTCNDIAKLCYMELDEAIDVDGCVGERERVGV